MIITNFAGGEISKNLYGRIDLPIYQSAVSRLENFNIIPTGGVSKRAGTKRIGKLKEECRLIPFIVNNYLSFIFEIGNEYIRIWKNGELLLINGYPLEFLSTSDIKLYSLAELNEIQIAQTHDSLYLAHRRHKPYCIKWQGGDSFTLQALSITGNAHKVPFQEPTEYPGCVAIFNGRLIFASSIKEPQKIWASKVFEYENFTYFDTIVSRTKQLKNPNLKIFTATATKDSDTLTALSKDFTDIENIETYYITGNRLIPKNTKVISVTNNTMKLSNKISESKEDLVLSIHLWKNPDSPQSTDYKDIEIINNVTTHAHSFSFEIGSNKNDAIKWLTPAQDLIIGTESSEWIMPAQTTALTISCILNSRYGVAGYQAVLIRKAIIFIGSNGKSIQDYHYDYEQRSYNAIDLTQASSHLFENKKAIDFDYVNSNDSKIFVTREDGIVCVLTYDKNNGIIAWSRLILGSGKIKNTAITSSDNGTEKVYFSVERNGNYYLEELTDEKNENAIYLDSFTKYISDMGFTDYENAIVYFFDDDKEFKINEVPDEYKTNDKKGVIGFKYKSIIESLPVINSAENNKKRIVSLLIRFLNSYLPFISQLGEKPEEKKAQEPYSGVVKIAVQGSFSRDVFFKIESEKAKPCTVLAVNAQLA